MSAGSPRGATIPGTGVDGSAMPGVTHRDGPGAPVSWWRRPPLWPRYAVIGLLRLYQLTLSPLLGPVCRFAPSCSSYAVEAVRIHGVVRGGWLTGRRLARCHPWNPGGWDPVPPARRRPRPSPTTTR